jgi:polyisoprenyl-phosphate glycosyltransferase
MLLSVVIPVLNEAKVVALLLERLRNTLHEVAWEAIFIDDGSTDGTPSILAREALGDDRIKLLRFSRNFGHQAAVTAGLDVANGDLQDPPEPLLCTLSLFQQGYDVVSPQRNAREGETLFKRWTSKVFYKILSRMADQPLTPDVGDFRLFSRRAVLAIRSLREQHRYMRGMVAWLGLKEIMLPFDRKPRAAGFLYLLRVMYLAFWTNTLVPGWASVVALQCVFSGMILLALGAIGDYVGRNYEEAKQRPLYVVTEVRNVALVDKALPRAVILADSAPPLGPFVIDDTNRAVPVSAAAPSYQPLAGVRA